MIQDPNQQEPIEPQENAEQTPQSPPPTPELAETESFDPEVSDQVQAETPTPTPEEEPPADISNISLDDLGAAPQRQDDEPEEEPKPRADMSGQPPMNPETAKELGYKGTGIYFEEIDNKPMTDWAAPIAAGILEAAEDLGLRGRPVMGVDPNPTNLYLGGKGELQYSVSRMNTRGTAMMIPNADYVPLPDTPVLIENLEKALASTPLAQKADATWRFGRGLATGIFKEAVVGTWNTAIDVTQFQQPQTAVKLVGEGLETIGAIDENPLPDFELSPTLEMMKVSPDEVGTVAEGDYAGTFGELAGTLVAYMLPTMGAMKALKIPHAGLKGFLASSTFGALTDVTLHRSGDDYAYEAARDGLNYIFGLDGETESILPTWEVMQGENWNPDNWVDYFKSKGLAALEGVGLGAIAEAGLRGLGLLGRQVGRRGVGMVALSERVINRQAYTKAYEQVLEHQALVMKYQREGMSLPDIEAKLIADGKDLGTIKRRHLIPAHAQLLQSLTENTARPMSYREALAIVTMAENKNADLHHLVWDPELIEDSLGKGPVKVSDQMSIEDNMAVTRYQMPEGQPEITPQNRPFQDVYDRFTPDELEFRRNHPTRPEGSTDERLMLDGKTRYLDLDQEGVLAPDIKFDQSEVDEIWENALNKHGEGGRILEMMQKVCDDANAELVAKGEEPKWSPKMPDLEIFNAWFSQPNKHRFWYEMAGGEANDRFRFGLTDGDGNVNKNLDIFLRWVANDSARTGIKPNSERSIGRTGDMLAGRYSDVTSVATNQSLLDVASGSDTFMDFNLKTPSFSESIKYSMGLTDRPPLAVIDAIMSQAFGMPGDAPGNTLIYEALANVIHDVARRANAKLPPGAEPFNPMQLQAMGWSDHRMRNPSNAAADLMSDGRPWTTFHEGWADIVELAKSRAGIDLPFNEQTGKHYFTPETWADPRLADMLHPNNRYRQGVPRVAVEMQTKLDPAVSGAVDTSKRYLRFVQDAQDNPEQMLTTVTKKAIKLWQETETAWNNIGQALTGKTARENVAGKKTQSVILSEVLQSIRGRGTLGMSAPIPETRRVTGIETGNFTPTRDAEGTVTGAEYFGPIGTYVDDDGNLDVGINIMFPATKIDNQQELDELVAFLAEDLRQERLYASTIEEMSPQGIDDAMDAIDAGTFDGWVTPKINITQALTVRDVQKLEQILGADISVRPGSNMTEVTVFPRDDGSQYLGDNMDLEAKLQAEGFQVSEIKPAMGVDTGETPQFAVAGYGSTGRGKKKGVKNSQKVLENMEERMLSNESRGDWLSEINSKAAIAGPIKKKLESKTMIGAGNKPGKLPDGTIGPPRHHVDPVTRRLKNTDGVFTDEEIKFIMDNDPRIKAQLEELKAQDPNHKGLDGLQFEEVRGAVSDLKTKVSAQDEVAWRYILGDDKTRREFLKSDDSKSILEGAVASRREELTDRIKSLPKDSKNAKQAKIDWEEQFKRVVPEDERGDFTTATARRNEAIDRTFSEDEQWFIGTHRYGEETRTGKDGTSKSVSPAAKKSTLGSRSAREISEALGRGSSQDQILGRTDQLRGQSDYIRQKHYRHQLAEARDAEYRTIDENRQTMEKAMEAENAKRDEIDPEGKLTRYQRDSAGQTPRGLVEFNEKSRLAVVRLGEAADMDTVLHEIGHVVRHHTMTGSRRGATSVDQAMISEIEAHYGVENGEWWKNEAADEAFANDFRDWALSNGNDLPDRRLRAAFNNMGAELRDVMNDMGEAGQLSPKATEMFRKLRKMDGLPIRYGVGKYLPGIRWDEVVNKMREMEVNDENWMDLISPEDLLGTARMNDGRVIGKIYHFDLDTPEDQIKMAAIYNDLARAAIESGVLKRAKSDGDLFTSTARRLNEFMSRDIDQLDLTIEDWLRTTWFDEPDAAVVGVTMMLQHQLERAQLASRRFAANPTDEIARAVMLREHMNYQVVQIHVAQTRTKSGRALRAWSRRMKMPKLSDIQTKEGARAFLKRVGSEADVDLALAKAIERTSIATNARQLADQVALSGRQVIGERVRAIGMEHYVNSMLYGFATWMPITGITSLSSALTMAVEGVQRVAGHVISGNLSEAFRAAGNWKRHVSHSAAGLKYAFQTLREEEAVLMGARATLDDRADAKFGKATHYGGDNWVLEGLINGQWTARQRADDVSGVGYGRIVRFPGTAIATQDEFIRQISARTALQNKFFGEIMEKRVSEYKAYWQYGEGAKSGEYQRLVDAGEDPLSRKALRRFAKAEAESADKEAVKQIQTVIKDGQMRNNGQLWSEAMNEEYIKTIDDPVERVRAAYTWMQETKRENPNMDANVQFAEEAAVKPVFQEELGSVAKMGQQIIDRSVVGRLIVPFYKTPVNIFKRFMGYVGGPLNLPMEGAGRIYNKIMNDSWSIPEDSPLGILHRKQFEDLASGDPNKIADVRGKQAAGVAMMTLFGSWAESGRITGGWPKDPNEREMLKDQGFQAYSFVFGDLDDPNAERTYVSFEKFQPVSNIPAIAADIYALAARFEHLGMDELTIGKVMMAAVYMVGEQVKAQPYLQGLENLMTIFESDPTDERSMTRALNTGQRIAGTMVAVPGAQAQQNVKNLTDPVVRQTRDLVDYLINRTFVGGTSGEQLPPAYTIFGEERQKFTGKTDKIAPWINTFSAVKIQSSIDEPAYRSLGDFEHAVQYPKAKRDGIDMRKYEDTTNPKSKDHYPYTAFDYYCREIGRRRMRITLENGKEFEGTFKEAWSQYVKPGGLAYDWYQMKSKTIGTDPENPGRNAQVEAFMELHTLYKNRAWQLTQEKFPLIRADMAKGKAETRAAQAHNARVQGMTEQAERMEEAANNIRNRENSDRQLAEQLGGGE